jgi:hypothetical protein
MANREEALRRIFEATGVSARLTDDQKRELLAHLEDSVESKIGAGAPEMDAVGQAFAELGDLEKIARNYPKAPALATSTGVMIEPRVGGLAEMGYCLLLFFTFVQLVITPVLLKFFVKLHVPMPGLTVLFWTLSDVMRTFWPALALTLAALAAAVIRARRTGKWKIALDLSLGLLGAALLGGVLAGVLLPFVSLIEGMTRR